MKTSTHGPSDKVIKEIFHSYEFGGGIEESISYMGGRGLKLEDTI